MGKYRFSPEARNDLKEIWRYGAKTWGEGQADTFYLAFFEHFDVLSNNPLLYQNVEHIEKGYRRSVFQKHSIYYRISGDTVEIMAIIGKQTTERRL